jgi:hypothetical protein
MQLFVINNPTFETNLKIADALNRNTVDFLRYSMVKSSLCVIKHHSMKTYGGVEVYLLLMPALNGVSGELQASVVYL